MSDLRLKYSRLTTVPLQLCRSVKWCENHTVKLECTPYSGISSLLTLPKVILQEKLISVAYTMRQIETSSLWAKFVNKNRCIYVRLVSEEVKSIEF